MLLQGKCARIWFQYSEICVTCRWTDNSMSIVVALSKAPNRTWCLQSVSTTLHRLQRIRHQPISCRTATLPVDLHYSSQAQVKRLNIAVVWEFQKCALFNDFCINCARGYTAVWMHVLGMQQIPAVCGTWSLVKFLVSLMFCATFCINYTTARILYRVNLCSCTVCFTDIAC
jgi:hypothetical protein